MSDERPEFLLKSALEKIVYFEARCAQLANDLERERSEAERLKQELGHAAQREIELRRVIAELEVRVTRAHGEREEASRLVDALRRERAELIGKMLDASRIHGAGDGLDDFDLAQFIAQLRSEVLLTRDGPVVAGPAIGTPRADVTGNARCDLAVGRTAAGEVETSARASTGGAVAAEGGGEGLLIDGADNAAPANGGGSVAQAGPSTAAEAAGDGAAGNVSAVGGGGPAAQIRPPPPSAEDTASGVLSPSRALAAVTRAAHELSAQGRLAVSEKDLEALTGARTFPGRSEETLFGFSVRELSAPDASARARAAERLLALAHPAAAPALAAALHTETEPAVQVALLAAFSALAKAEGVPIVRPLLTSRSPDVRIAALKALLALDAGQAGPHLAAAMSDPDKAVRRRASLLALGLGAKQALELGTQAIRDADPDVRALAVLVLGASQADAARPLLLDAMRDADARVRRSASQALSRLLGRDVTGLVGLEDAQRRREVRRLAHLPAQAVSALPARHPASAARRISTSRDRRAVSPATSGAGAAAREANGAAPRPAAGHRRFEGAAGVSRVGPSGFAPGAARTAVAVLEDDAPPPPSAALCDGIVRELRAAIRGRPLPDLAQTLGASTEDTLRACAALMQRGQVVRRGLKYFVA